MSRAGYEVPRQKRDPYDPLDVHIGNRIRETRNARGVLLETIGERLGVTWQQIQKYEKGQNRVSASALFRIAAILDVPTTHFFAGQDGSETIPPMPPSSSDREGLLRELNRMDPELVEIIGLLIAKINRSGGSQD